MKRSPRDDWLYDRVILQLLGTSGTVECMELQCKRYISKQYYAKLLANLQIMLLQHLSINSVGDY